mgnify:FL=1|jgi:hypothetical protein
MIIAEKEISILNLPSEEQQEQKRKEAFDAEYVWQGKCFTGLTSARKDLWTSFCHKAGFPLLSQCFDDVSLFTPLAKALLFVCLAPKAELKRLRAAGMDKMLDAFEDWCDANVPIRLEADAISLGIAILNDSGANHSEVVASEGSAVGKS